MDIEYIEDLITRENIHLVYTYLENTKGSYISYRDIRAILCDNNKIKNSAERKQILSEELGHYYYDATYKFNSDLQLISKQEYKAKKFSYNVLIPLEKLKLAILKRD